VAGLPPEESYFNTTFDNLQRINNYVSEAISRLVEKMYELPLCFRQIFIYQSLHLFLKKAMFLIKFVEEIGENFESENISTAPFIKTKVLTYLDMDQDTLNIILSLAEKLSPGIYQEVQGDNSEKLVELILI